MGNLDIAFPEKSKKEKEAIARKFYQNFFDFIIESIKAFTMSEAELKKRYIIDNFSDVKEYLSKHQKGAIFSATHAFNWEWMIIYGSLLPDGIKAFVSYTPLSNNALNKLLVQNRERFGLNVVPAKQFAETIKSANDKMIVISGLIADQSPGSAYKYRESFFGVNVPFYNGPERFAVELNHSYWFLNIQKTKRSYYHLNLELIADNPTEFAPGELTRIYIEKTESLIRKFPENYLWTHRRWKHRKKE